VHATEVVIERQNQLISAFHEPDHRYGVSMAQNKTNLICPIRGHLQADYFAADGITVSEEARRIDCINYLLKKGYPTMNFKCESVVIKQLGHSGQNSLRADLIVYDEPIAIISGYSDEVKNNHALIVAEIKRDSKSAKKALRFQLEPALRQLDRSLVYGVYWDDVNRRLFVKKTENNSVAIIQDELGNLPKYGDQYRYKKLKYEDLIKPEDITATLAAIANILRSNHINDDSTRYRETVKLLLAKYIDEREARESKKDLILQVAKGEDYEFMQRVTELYKKTARIYHKAASIFSNDIDMPEEKALREIVQSVQGLNLLESNNDSMQQVFMTFVPAVFKKDMDQFFTPLTLIDCMVEVLRPGPNDKIADPAMGTADFLTSAMQYRLKYGDQQIMNRVFGADKDRQAYELAIINMILNKDGQTNLHNVDSIKEHKLWHEEMDIALCNPPFGSRTVETRRDVLSHYDLGYEWVMREGRWHKTDNVSPSQQLGILFIERCFKLLTDGGRMGIILPEGYLCTASYGYVRQWILAHFKVIGLVELPRRIFLKSEADLRSNILFAEKNINCKKNYPIHSELVRNVGYKLGKGFFAIPLREKDSGLEVRDCENKPQVDSDFERVKRNFLKFLASTTENTGSAWSGAHLQDVTEHRLLDMKPRRLNFRALSNINTLKHQKHVRLGEIAMLVDEAVVLRDRHAAGDKLYFIEGQDIRAIEGVVALRDRERRWEIEVRKAHKAYEVLPNDIILGLVRPERRNIGLFFQKEEFVYASTDGVAIIRGKPELEELFPIEWIFKMLRTESTRLQLWTESGGTSYGKLTADHINNVLLRFPPCGEAAKAKQSISQWSGTLMDAAEKFNSIWDAEDKVAILNSPIIGLEIDDIPVDSTDD
jgi:type I restriction enzyme M protein